MPWYAGADIPIEKPNEIRELEQVGKEELSSMPPREMEEKVSDSAQALARGYKKEMEKSDYEGCVSIVSAALSVTGNSLGGDFGAFMVGRSHKEAEIACRRVFKK